MAKNSSPSRAPKTGAQLRDNPEEREKCVKAAEKPSHRHMTACRNNVQIFNCELSREAGTTNTMNICEILTEATQTDARRDCQILLVQIIIISKCELQGVRSPLFMWEIEEIRPSLRGLSQRTVASGCQKQEAQEITARFQANSASNTKKNVNFFHKPPYSNRVPRHIDDLVNLLQHPDQVRRQRNCGHLSLFTIEESTRSAPSRTLSTLK